MSKENSIKPLSKESFYIANPKEVVVETDRDGYTSIYPSHQGDAYLVYKVNGVFYFNVPPRNADYSTTLQFIQREFDANGVEVFSERVGINENGVISYINSQMVS